MRARIRTKNAQSHHRSPACPQVETYKDQLQAVPPAKIVFQIQLAKAASHDPLRKEVKNSAILFSFGGSPP